MVRESTDAHTYVGYLFVFINDQTKELETVIGPLWEYDGHCCPSHALGALSPFLVVEGALRWHSCGKTVTASFVLSWMPDGAGRLGYLHVLPVRCYKQNVHCHICINPSCVCTILLPFVFLPKLTECPCAGGMWCVPVTGTDLVPTAVGHVVGQEDRWERVMTGCRCAVRKRQSGLGAKHPRSCTCPSRGPARRQLPPFLWTAVTPPSNWPLLLSQPLIE